MEERNNLDFITIYKPEERLTKHYEGVFTQGSGYLHIRGSYEEGLRAADQNESYMRLPANVTIEKPKHPRSKWGTYVPGITGLHPLLKEELVNLPNPLVFQVRAGQEALDMDESDIKDYEQSLNLKNGVLTRDFCWETKEGPKVSASYQRYVSRTERNVIVQKMQYAAVDMPLTLTLISNIDENVKTNGYNHFTHVGKSGDGNVIRVEVTTDNGDTVRLLGKTVSEGCAFAWQDSASRAAVELRPGEPVTVYKWTMVSTSRDTEGFLSFDEMEEKLQGLAQNECKLYEDHCRVWEDLWQQCEVVIEGDEKAQRALNFSIYHLLRSVNDKDNRIAVCAKGFAGEAYFGHFFWDTEVYLLPFFLYTRPEAARKLVEFRINTLKGAKKNARAYGYSGARYPWESSVSGEEQCPNWQYADHEVHVTADVTFGLWHYYQVTGDKEFLREAAQVFVETARYWLERMEFCPDGTAHINGVMGPDEYVCFCNDNAYTNFMVAKSLRNTKKVVELLRQTTPEIEKELGIEEAFLTRTEEAANRPVILKNQEGIIQQCQGFADLEEPDFEKLWTDRDKPFGQFVSQERNYRTKALKQADVLMLFYLFGQELKGESLEKNYQYYLPYTTHDSSLSSIVHAILCCRRGEAEEAYDFFKKALDIDLSEEKAGAAEGIHIANSGGIWQGVIFGFAGMRWAYEGEELNFAPTLPKHWKSIRFPVWYKGLKHRIEVTQEGVWIDGQEHVGK